LFTDSVIDTWRLRSNGAYRLATELRQNGYTVKVIDWTCHIFSDHRLSLKIIKSLIGANTLFVGFSGSHFHRMNVTNNTFDRFDRYQSALGTKPYPYPGEQKLFEMTIFQMKKLNSRLKIAYGGSWANGAFKLSGKIDYIVEGLADQTIIELASHLKNKTPIKWVPGAHPGQKIISHDKLGLSFDFPTSYTQYEPHDHIRPGEIMCLETSRGCMFKCKFCNFLLIGRKATDPKYHKELSILTQELKHNWDNYKINRYYILDDTFNETTEKMQMIHQAVIDAGVPDFKFFAYLRLDLIRKHPEQIDLLKEMGLCEAYFGIESLNDETLKIIAKPMKSKLVKSFLGELKTRWGNSVIMHGSFIMGLPADTPETFASWWPWVASLECPLDSANLSWLSIDQALPNAFGVNLDQYGYEMLPMPGETGPLYNWKSAVWDRDYCKEEAGQLNREMFLSRRKTPHAWEAMGLMDLGYSFEHVRDTASLDFDRLEIKKRIEDQRDAYIRELCNYEGIDYEHLSE